jgi:hypothetical protein
MLLANRKLHLAGVMLAVLWASYNLAVLLKTGFISDDAYNAQIRGQIMQQGVSLNDRVIAEIAGWLRGAGRLMVVTWYMTYGLYYFTQDTVLVKALTIAVILAVVWLFYVFSKRQTGSAPVSLLACLLIPCFFQFRFWHDPILAFTFLMPMTFALVLGALVLFQRHLDNKATATLAFAVALFVSALLLYEIAFPLCLLFVAVAYAHGGGWRSTLGKSLPFTAPAVLLIGVSASFRLYFIKMTSYAQSTYPGAELHLDAGKLFNAFGIQAFSTVPLSYYFFTKDAVASTLKRADYLVLLLLAAGLCLLVYRIGRSARRPVWTGWVLCGLTLLLLPAGLTSLSGHQAELIQAGWGYGYIPVFLQYFGLCILLVSMLASVATRLQPWWALAAFSAVVGLGATAVGGVNLALNRAIALKTNEIYKYPRALLGAAIKSGITNGMKDGTLVLRTMRFASDYTWFYTLASGKKLDVCELSDAAVYIACIEKAAGLMSRATPGMELLDTRDRDVWALSYNFDVQGGKTGRVVAGKVDFIARNSATRALVQLVVSKARVFTQADGQLRDFTFAAPVNFLRIADDQSAAPAAMQALDSPAFKAPTVDFEWMGKVYPREGTATANLRWSSGSATLALYNLTDLSQRVEISMALATANSGNSHMAVKLPGGLESVTVNQQPLPFVKKLELPPGKTEIEFSSDAGVIKNGDPRNIVFGVFNFLLKPLENPALR